jgi:hypothetical protein
MYTYKDLKTSHLGGIRTRDLYAVGARRRQGNVAFSLNLPTSEQRVDCMFSTQRIHKTLIFLLSLFCLFEFVFFAILYLRFLNLGK